MEQRMTQPQSCQTMVVREVRYHYREAGSGTLLLLLHGFTLSHETWAGVVDKLAEHYHVVAPDLLGHGSTDCPADDERFTMAEVVLDLQIMMESFGESPYYVLGYSMGGRVALSYATAYPQIIKGLVLESASPGLKTSQERAVRRESDEALAQKIENLGVPAFVAEWEQTPLFSSMQRLPDATIALQRKIRRAQSSKGLAASLRGFGTGQQPALWEELSSLSVPVCLISGSLDLKFTSIAAEMSRIMPNAKHVVVEDSGHTPHIEQPDRFLETVEHFLGTNE